MITVAFSNSKKSCFFITILECIVDYNGFSQFIIGIHNENDLVVFDKFDKTYGDKVDYWHKTKIIGKNIVLLSSPKFKIGIEELLKFLKLDFKIITKNWNDPLMQKNKKSKRHVRGNKINLEVFHSYNDSIHYFEYLESKYKDIVEINDLGITSNGRIIKYITIGYKTDKKKPIVIIESGAHGREWITQSSILIFIDNLIKNRNLYNKLFKKLNIIIIPSLNPDGYEYSREKDRMWRGNRNIKSNNCGVDINRNFDFKWKKDYEVCETYSGEKPNSENETLGFVNLVKNNINYIKGYLSLHSYGRYIIYPWSYEKKTYTKEHDEIVMLAKKMIFDIKKETNASYIHGTAADILYNSYGCALDYMKSLGVKYTYALEIAPSDGLYNGFIVSEDLILPASKEFEVAAVKFLNQIYEEF
ncbi:Peptidase M14, carboxypeptidase A domain-containing protein [Strongyloides ratti]|uniref:Peptidase M14, carboxypeptidase A domain-containing protein n=1 Tax=Strongyloides ratti TaxID=34506 RepID=A0A090LPI7_STRRB|nr:Peptidase M14, carboxypeptidase A domain-containing protein [Strongyloides ratti]CEF69455.1 Peptidase M14, carboxypeptidase A domain-containing protein [Strongyloides ratti]